MTPLEKALAKYNAVFVEIARRKAREEERLFLLAWEEALREDRARDRRKRQAAVIAQRSAKEKEKNDKCFGKSKIPEYNIWQGMWQRCTNPQNHSWKYYGGRGISVAPEWMDFKVFIHNMGFRPSPRHSLDRIDNDRNYEPGNCRWALPNVQALNKRQRRGKGYYEIEPGVWLVDVQVKNVRSRKLVRGTEEEAQKLADWFRRDPSLPPPPSSSP